MIRLLRRAQLRPADDRVVRPVHRFLRAAGNPMAMARMPPPALPASASVGVQHLAEAPLTLASSLGRRLDAGAAEPLQEGDQVRAVGAVLDVERVRLLAPPPWIEERFHGRD